MNLVFQAGGLKTGEGAFLMACANHTDDRGYAIVSFEQLVDEAHMQVEEARSVAQRLVHRGLLAFRETGGQSAALVRINVDLLAGMARCPEVAR